MTVSFEEAEKIRAEYRKMLAEKDKPKKETKAESPDESVSSSKSRKFTEAVKEEIDNLPGPAPATFGVDELSAEQKKQFAKFDKEMSKIKPPKKKRGRPKKKKD
jgi:hypothetical protein